MEVIIAGKSPSENVALIVAMSRANIIGGTPRVVAAAPLIDQRKKMLEQAEAALANVVATPADINAINQAEAKRQRRAAKRVELSSRR